MTTPEHITRIIERIEPADREALEQHLAEVRAQAIEQAIAETRQAMHDGAPRWLCRVVDLQAVAERLRSKEAE